MLEEGKRDLALLKAPGVGESQSPPEGVRCPIPSHTSMDLPASLLPPLVSAFKGPSAQAAQAG